MNKPEYDAAEPELIPRFEEVALPHLDAAYNLARWIVRDDHDAQDVVQEAYLRALKFFRTFRGGNARVWLLTIVRHTCYSWLKENRARGATPFDETIHGTADDVTPQEFLTLKKDDERLVKEALEKLPVEFREVILLREMEGLSYKEIAEMAGVPMGTVMSRLARARKWLHELLSDRFKRKEA